MSESDIHVLTKFQHANVSFRVIFSHERLPVPCSLILAAMLICILHTFPVLLLLVAAYGTSSFNNSFCHSLPPCRYFWHSNFQNTPVLPFVPLVRFMSFSFTLPLLLLLVFIYFQITVKITSNILCTTLSLLCSIYFYATIFAKSKAPHAASSITSVHVTYIAKNNGGNLCQHCPKLQPSIRV